MYAMEAFGETLFAIDHALDVAAAINAQRFAACAAIMSNWRFGMIRSVHTNLVYVVTVSTGC